MRKNSKFILVFMIFGLFTLPLTNFFNSSNKYISDTNPNEINKSELKSSTIFISENTIWNLSNSPYILNETYVVESGVTLTIESGVEVLFNGFYSLIVDGMLNATGTSGNPISFSSNKTSLNRGDWDSINFRNPTLNSILENVRISYADIGIEIQGGLPAIINNTIYENNYGILSFDLNTGDLIIENNVIYNTTFENIRIQDLSGNNVNYYIRNNKIFNSSNSYSAIDLRPDGVSQIIFENNQVYDNAGSGIRIAYADLSNLIFQNNTIYNNRGSATDRFGVGFKGVRLLNPLIIQYNEIYNNSNNGIFIEDVAGYPCCNSWIDYISIQHNKIYNNLNDGVFSSQNKVDTLIFRYNEIYNNSNNGFSVSDDSYNFKSLFFQNNEVYNNSNGLYMTYWVENDYIIENNNLYNNSNYAIRCEWQEPLKTIRAKKNWWGTNVTNEIDAMIYDYYDNILYAKVDYSDFLNHSVIETYNSEPPRWNNFTVNDTSIYTGEFVNISIDVFDNINISKVWIEINDDTYFLNQIQNTSKYYFIFIPAESKVYPFTLYINDTSGIITSFSGLLIVLRVNRNGSNGSNDNPANFNPWIIIIIIFSSLIGVSIPKTKKIISKQKKSSRKEKRSKLLDLKKKPKGFDKVEFVQKAEAKRQVLLKKTWRPEGFKDLTKIPIDTEEEIDILQIFKEDNALENLLTLDDLNLTVLSKDFLEKIEMFEWENDEKDDFIEDMLGLIPNQRQAILKRMIKKSNLK